MFPATLWGYTKMFQWLSNSLPVRAGIAVILIAVLALSSALSAGLIAWISEDDAAAINTAGSLRMATYRLSWKLQANAPASELQQLAEDLQTRLNSPALQKVLQGKPNDPIVSAFSGISQQWQQTLVPALNSGNRERFFAGVDPFVSQLNHAVMLLQQQSEQRQGWQQTIQGAALMLTIFILVIGMFELNLSVLTPLKEIGQITERFRNGDLNARVSYQSADELGQMADSFNSLADTIQEAHRTLESRVEEKTHRLAQSNAALELLYRTSAQIAAHPANAEQLDSLIEQFQAELPGLRLTLCLHGTSPTGSHLIALHGMDEREICSRMDCGTCERHNSPKLEKIDVSSQGVSLGELKAHYVDGHPAASWELELIEALANLIGASLSLEKQREQDHRLLLLDERNTIARELHDSLAQALSYMKLQVSRMHTLIQRGESPDLLLSVSDELREGLNNAYRQLRELLTTFRLQLKDGNLDKALDDTAREFAGKGNFRVLLSVPPLPFGLTAPEQIDLLQITREALSNCTRHSQAEQVWVGLVQQQQELVLSIEDDGVGLSGDVDTRQHHGLAIIQERTRNLGGTVHWLPRLPHGTRVELRFCPEFLRPTTECTE